MTLWLEHRGFILVLAASTLALLVLDRVAPGLARPLAHLPSALLTLVLVADLALARLVWERLRTRASWREAYGRLRSGPLSSRRLAGLALVAFLTRWMLVAAVAWKTAIPALHPFAYDIALADVDAFLHGQDPWRLLAPILGSDVAMRMIDGFYYAWFLAFAFVMLHAGWQPYSVQRRRFLTAMALTWTIGAVVSVWVSSAGPVYYGALTGDAFRFGPLVERIGGLRLLAAGVQAILWDGYTNGATSVIAGIAAFPSLHVGVPALIALAHRGRARTIWWVYTALTLLGSVVLGWHYAVDGYAAIAGAAAIWWLSGRITR